MTHGERKSRRMRGSRTCGYGNAQKHRGAGHRGGRGMAGSKKQKWMKLSRDCPDFLGKKGFKRSPKLRSNPKTINVSDVEENLDLWVEKGFAQKTGDTYEVDLKSLGFDKLLGAGEIKSKTKILIPSYSLQAQEKISAVGGEIASQ
ncbi:MAG: 50S ribosomal protein L15 [Candidatus Altiarchaeales archaeon]|nr:50S ribosomal protein L15 [Candidatus Altiarchaeales archaeon]